MQSSSQIITTNKPTSSFFTGRMPFLSPNQQCQSTEGKISHSLDLLTPSSPGGLPTLSLTTNSSCLPWGRVAMPLISPLMPVPQSEEESVKCFNTLILVYVIKGYCTWCNNSNIVILIMNKSYTVFQEIKKFIFAIYLCVCWEILTTFTARRYA